LGELRHKADQRRGAGAASATQRAIVNLIDVMIMITALLQR
jgi:hypothetical protein